MNIFFVLRENPYSINLFFNNTSSLIYSFFFFLTISEQLALNWIVILKLLLNIEKNVILTNFI